MRHKALIHVWAFPDVFLACLDMRYHIRRSPVFALGLFLVPHIKEQRNWVTLSSPDLDFAILHKLKLQIYIIN